jgi:hypothetical protein
LKIAWKAASIASSGVGKEWYGAALFKQPPQLIKKLANATGDAASKLPDDVSAFCSKFAEHRHVQMHLPVFDVHAGLSIIPP